MKKKTRQQTTVLVSQVSSVELTKAGSRNSLELEVRSGTKLLGKLIMGRGSVKWWPNGNKTNNFRRSWVTFAKLLETEMQK
jgi:hypothetical protein